MNRCSDGSTVSEATIMRRYLQAKKERYQGYNTPICPACGKRKMYAPDHTISQKRCKHLGKTELIWSTENWEDSCKECHTQWESYKDGECINHHNFEKRMVYLYTHDREGYNARVAHLEYLNQTEKL